MIEFIQILLDINILTKFGADWSIFADDRLCINTVKYNITFFFFFLNKKSNPPETLWVYISWPSLVVIGLYLQMLECKNCQTWQIFRLQGHITQSSGPIRSIIELIRDLMVIYILTKFCAIGQYLYMLECKQSRFSNFSKFKGKYRRMFWFDLSHNRTHPRLYGYIYCGQDWYWLVNICRC